MRLKFQVITKSFGDTRRCCVAWTFLEIERGESLVILGGSGSGQVGDAEMHDGVRSTPDAGTITLWMATNSWLAWKRCVRGRR